MRKQNIAHLRTGIIVFFCVLTAALCRQISVSEWFVNAFFSILRPTIYIGLYFAWIVSFQRRILHRRTRYYLTGISALMIFWMCMRTCRYMTPLELVGLRHLEWYLYYLPLLMIPTISLFLALSMRKPEHYTLPKKIHLLYVPALALTALVLTNDLHQFVFQFPEGAVWSNRAYRYRFGYYLVAGWIIGCTVAALLLILMKCRKPKSRKRVWMPFAAFGFCLVYGVFYCLGSSLWKILAGDMTSVFCLFIAIILESCIWCGMIPSNTGHDRLFANAGLSAQITDHDYRVCYSQKDLDILPTETMRQTEHAPVMMEKGIRLSGAPIRGGYVLWREDVSELQAMLKELADMREQLRDVNLIEKENLKAKRRIAQLSIKNQLYDTMQQQMAGQIALLLELTEQIPQCGGEKEKQKLFGKMAVIGAYLKRRSNLIFITSQNPVVPVQELRFCFEESLRGLSLYGIDGSFSSSRETDISGTAAIQIYDFFEAVLERTLDELVVVAAHLGFEESVILFTMSMECTGNPEDALRPLGAAMEQDFDGAWLISLKVPAGGVEK